jgi:hypothetical protein
MVEAVGLAALTMTLSSALVAALAFGISFLGHEAH